MTMGSGSSAQVSFWTALMPVWQHAEGVRSVRRQHPTMRKPGSLVVALSIILSTGFGFAIAGDTSAQSGASPLPDSPAIQWARTFRTLPINFVQNEGQIPNSAVTLYTMSGDVRVGFTTGAVLVTIVRGVGPETPRVDTEFPRSLGESRGVLVRLTFDGANPVEPVGRGELSHRSHF